MSSFDTLNLLQIDTMKSIEFVRPNEKLMKYGINSFIIEYNSAKHFFFFFYLYFLSNVSY